MNSALLSVLRIAGLAVLLVAAWTVWERRVTLGSRIDSGATVSTALFGVGAALDSPWSQIAAASHPLTGEYYALTMVGHLCYITGAALGLRSIYRRLLSDDVFDHVMRKWLLPFVAGVVVIMVSSFSASAVTSTMPAVHLYLVHPDGWLTVYFLAHFGTMTLLGAICGYGIYRLRLDPRAVLLNLMLVALLVAAVCGGVGVGWGVITGRIETLRLVAWLLTYAAFVAAGVGSVLQWRHRVQALVQPPRSQR